MVACLFIAGLADQGLALDPSQPFDSYIRTRFANDDGLPAGVVNDIVQTHDGFLWLSVGSSTLMRFDGRHFTEFLSPRPRALAVAPDGDLWAGTEEGLSRIPAAELNQFGRLPSISYLFAPGKSPSITCLHFGRSGVLWVGTGDGLYRFERGGLSSVSAGFAIIGIEEASNGHLMLTTSQGFMEMNGDAQLAPHPEFASQLGVKAADIFHVIEDRHGTIWFCTSLGVARQRGGSIEWLPPHGAQKHGAFRAYEDPEGNVWFARRDGLFRAAATGLELMAPDLDVRILYGDREGDLWVGTNGAGLIRFKNRAVRMFTTADGLPKNVVMTVLASHDGKLWSGVNCGGISWFDGHRFHTYSEKDGLRNGCVWALAEDAQHDLWIGTYGGGAFRFRDGHFTQYEKAQGLASDIVTSIVPARDGSIWFATPVAAIQMRDGQVRNYTTADGLSSNGVINIFEDRNGVIWAGTTKGVDRLTSGRFTSIPSVPKALAWVTGEDRSGGLYLYMTLDGLFRLDANRQDTVNFDLTGFGMVQTREGDSWLSGTEIVRVPAGALERLRDHDEPLNYTAFGRADGLTAAECGSGFPSLALTPDGKLWAATVQGLAMLDLPRLPKTDQKIAIYIEDVTVGRNQKPPGHELVLPPDTHHVELHFDAIESSSPEKIRLQYRLDGVDSEWLDVKPPGHATYSDIPAGTHAFHVRSCDRDGIWDRTGMVYNITRQPYYYETKMFWPVTGALGFLLLAGFHRWRLSEATARLKAGLEVRLGERERIARELHDTLLQSFHGLMLRLQAVDELLPPGRAKEQLEKTLERADQAISEGRSAIYNLRSSTTTVNDLAEALRGAADELAGEGSISFRLVVEGPARDLHPILRGEVYRIGREALRNAFSHSRARHIEAEVTYDERLFRLRIRDDGDGIPADILESGRSGHYGLNGMRERAKQVGAKLDIWSGAGTGTEIHLGIPGSIAYCRSPGRSRFWLFRKKVG